MTRDEFKDGLRIVVPVTLAAMAAGYSVITVMLVMTDFKDAYLHYTLTTVFPLVLTPATVFPLAIMSQRLGRVKHELEALLRVDTLTELPNRRAFFEFAGRVCQSGQDASLMMIDIDHFKSVNDRFGHDVGDIVLHAVAQSVQRIVASSAGSGRKVAARIGGEEFAIVVEGLDGAATCRLADEIVDRIRTSPVCVRGLTIPVTVSVGVAQSRPGESADAVLRAADNACYRAKRLGRDQWRAADGVAERAPPNVEPRQPIRRQMRQA